MRRLFIAFILTTIAVTASAQHHGPGGHHSDGPAGASPYADFATRSIKALSQQQVDDLLAGRGTGLALAAELNSYAGPMHVLELRQALGLTAAQSARMEALMADMRAAAVMAGERAVAAERALDQIFATGKATEDGVRQAVLAAAEAHGHTRLIHLATHIKVRAELSTAQTAAYERLRGYRAP